MATMADKHSKRTRRSFTEAFKAGAGRLVLDEGKTVGAAARDLDVTESSLRNWVERARADRGNGKPGVLTTAEREELSRLRKDNRELRMERDILKKSGGLLRERAQLRFACIEAEKAEFPMRRLYQVLKVSPSGFDAWRRRPESAHAHTDRRLRVLVRASFEESHQRYGSPRVYEDRTAQQIRISRKRVVRLMREEGLKARMRTRFTITTMSDHDHPVADTFFDREFTAATVNQRWVGDTTEFVIGESGKLYLAAMLDMCSRFVVGWAISAVNDRHLTIPALEMALKRRCPDSGLRHHSDRGSPYASEDDQAILEAHASITALSSQSLRRLMLARDALFLDSEDRARRSVREPRPSQARVVRVHRSVL